MEVFTEINIDLAKRKFPEQIHAMQLDANTRVVAVSLYDSGMPWDVPDGVSPSVAFRKSDGKGGWYSELPDGTDACAVDGNEVTVTLAPEVLTCAGKTEVAIVLQDSETLDQIASFPFDVIVTPNPAAGKDISNNYFEYKTMADVNEALRGIRDDIGDMNLLQTSAKDNLVAAINAAARSGGSSGGGLSANAKSLLMTVLRNAVYVSDQVENLSDLELALAESGGTGGGGGAVCVVTLKLTNVTVKSDMGTILDFGSSYHARLVPDGGYDISSVSITMGGDDITAAVYFNGVVDIPGVSGNVVITAVAKASTSLLHSWDFTKSLEDTAGDQAALIPNASAVNTTKNKATRDDDGIHITTAFDFAYITNAWAPDRTYEFDIGDVAAEYGSSAHARLICCEKAENPDAPGSATNSVGYAPYCVLIWNKAGYWSAHFNGAWLGTSSIWTTVNAFANKTIKISVSASGTVSISVDGEVGYSYTVDLDVFSTHPHLCLGSYGTSCPNTIFKAVRIYEGVR